MRTPGRPAAGDAPGRGRRPWGEAPGLPSRTTGAHSFVPPLPPPPLGSPRLPAIPRQTAVGYRRRMHLSRRALAIPPSVTLGLDAQVAALKAEGVDVISLAAGQPDFAGPVEATEAALRFLSECGGKVRYTPSSGIPQLREAAAAQLRQVTGVPYQPAQVVVTCGAKEAIHLANDTEYGLAAAVFSPDAVQMQRVAQRLRAGVVWKNCCQPVLLEAPWGGYKNSGVGRDLGVEGLHAFMESKVIVDLKGPSFLKGAYKHAKL